MEQSAPRGFHLGMLLREQVHRGRSCGRNPGMLWWKERPGTLVESSGPSPGLWFHPTHLYALSPRNQAKVPPFPQEHSFHALPLQPLGLTSPFLRLLAVAPVLPSAGE